MPVTDLDEQIGLLAALFDAIDAYEDCVERANEDHINLEYRLHRGGGKIEGYRGDVGLAFLKLVGRDFHQLTADEADEERNIRRDQRLLERKRARAKRRDPIPQDLRWSVFQRDNFTCRGCGSRSRLEADHVHPLSRGGATSFDNLQTLCHDCNAAKGARI